MKWSWRKREKPGSIILKMNALQDPTMINRLTPLQAGRGIILISFCGTYPGGKHTVVTFVSHVLWIHFWNTHVYGISVMEEIRNYSSAHRTGCGVTCTVASRPLPPILGPGCKAGNHRYAFYRSSQYKRKPRVPAPELRNCWKSTYPQKKEKVRSQYTFYEYLKEKTE